MNYLTIKVMSFVIVFVSLFSIAGYACSYPFCSSIACKSNTGCHDTCDGGFWYYGNKICSSSCYFSSSNHCSFEKKTCADSDASDNFPIIGCSVKTCNAECDQNVDCKDKCVGDVRYYSGSCNLTSTCSCSYKTENCNSKDDWYNTTKTQWVSNGQCTEKEQKQQEYRNYACSSTPSLACTYTVTGNQWIDIGNIRNKQNGTTCDDGISSTINDICTEGVCTGSAIDCSSNNLQEIAMCDWNQDNNNSTWDFRNAFISYFDEGSNKCTTGNDTITHMCSKANCNAECDQSSDCSCPSNGCVGQDFYDYHALCNESCSCECTPIITFNDSRCFVCDSNNVDCNNPACASNIQCLPCDTNNVNCSIPACTNNDLCVSCDSTNVNCSVPSCLSNPKCAPCDVSNVDCNVLACANNMQCLPCDSNNVDCNVPACASNPSCVKPPPSSGGGTEGGTIISGGYIPPITTAFCGDGVCSYKETCSSCPKDCLKQGKVCCDNVAYPGNCCVNSDCPNGYECNASKECQLIFVQPNVTCTEDWICTNWSECINSTQTRKCVDKNNCGTTISKPEETQNCETQITPITGLFNFITSPVVLISLISILLLFLILIFFKRRKSKGQVVQASQTTL